MEIRIKHKRINIQVDDIRDHSPFLTVRMPHLTSNIPLKIFYSAFGAEILQTVIVNAKHFAKTSVSWHLYYPNKMVISLLLPGH